MTLPHCPSGKRWTRGHRATCKLRPLQASPEALYYLASELSFQVNLSEAAHKAPQYNSHRSHRLAVVLPLQNEERSLSTLKRDFSGAPQVHLRSYGLRQSRSLSTFFVSGKFSLFLSKQEESLGLGPGLAHYCQGTSLASKLEHTQQPPV